MAARLTDKRIDELTPYERNPRKNDAAVEYVANSIREFGFKVPIVIDADGVIVAGHTRYKAAQMLGLETVPCIVADDLTPEQIKAFRLADNKVGEIAEWDFELLDLELGDIADIDMSAFGFGFGEDEPQEVVEDDYEPESPAEPKAKRGDIYQLGRHRLMCGDSTSMDDVQTLVGGAQIDLLLTDPPYNVDYDEKERDLAKIRPNKRVSESKFTGIKNDKMQDDEFRLFLRDAFVAADSVMKAGAVFYIWHADSEGYNFRGACRDVGWNVRQCLIWKKTSISLGRQDYQWMHEPCLYGWKDGAGHLWASDRKQTTVLNFEKPNRSELHPTMKPVALFDYQIQNNTKGEDAVLDLFGGSGTTMIACEQNGRNAYLMELDPRYVDVIIDRWEKFTGQKAVLLNGETAKGNQSN